MKNKTLSLILFLIITLTLFVLDTNAANSVYMQPFAVGQSILTETKETDTCTKISEDDYLISFYIAEKQCLITGVKASGENFGSILLEKSTGPGTGVSISIKVSEKQTSNDNDYLTLEELVDVINNGTYTQKLIDEMNNLKTKPSESKTYVIQAGSYENKLYFQSGYDNKLGITTINFDPATHKLSFQASNISGDDLQRSFVIGSNLMNWIMEASPNYSATKDILDNKSETSLGDEFEKKYGNLNYVQDNENNKIEYEFLLSKQINNDFQKAYNDSIKNLDSTNKSVAPTEKKDDVKNPKTGAFANIIGFTGIAIYALGMIIISIKNKKIFKI